MTTSQLPITVDIAKAKCLYRTSVLGPYKDSSMFLLQKAGSGEEPRAVYRVEKDFVTVILKTATCPKQNQESIKRIQEEFNLAMKAYKAARDGVVLPISFEEIIDNVLGEYCFEAVYEYGGENLLTALKNSNARDIMNVMRTVAKIMARLEVKNIFHSDIKPANIVISDGVVKLLDFGVAMVIDSKTLMFKTKSLKGGTLIYLPPEVLKSQQGEPTAVDVYAWGITLYQLLTGQTEADLEKDIDLRKTNYKSFLENVQNFEVKRDPDGSIKKKASEILQKVLDLNPKLRPNFSTISTILSNEESVKDELKRIKQILLKVIQERDKFKAQRKALFDDHNKCSDIQIDLLVEFSLNQIRLKSVRWKLKSKN